jgi:ankyrin repeat protein
MLTSIDGHDRNLFHICARTPFIEIFDFLKTIDGINIDKLDKFGFAPLHYAAEYGNEEMLSRFLNNADRGLVDWRGQSAVHIAAEVGAPLGPLAAASVAPDRSGRSPLRVAIQNGNLEAVRGLVRSGAHEDGSDAKGSFAKDIQAVLEGREVPRVERDRFYYVAPRKEVIRAKTCGVF